MYAVFKGLKYLDQKTLPIVGDWYDDYTTYLVNNQRSDHSWSAGSWDVILDTSWAILILQGTVLPADVKVTIPPPGHVLASGYNISIDYAVMRFPVNGEFTISEDQETKEVIPLTNFMGSATWHQYVTDNPGEHIWGGLLNGTTQEGSPVSAKGSGVVTVHSVPTWAPPIPDQTSPFTPIDLNDYIEWVNDGYPYTSSFSASDPGGGWGVTIDANGVATVTSPPGAQDAKVITFTAAKHYTCCNLTAYVYEDVTFSHCNPVPELTSVDPSNTTAGGPAFNLAVYGANFLSTSVVRWDGSDRDTRFISDTELSASIFVADITRGGVHHVTVYNLPPCGGESKILDFSVRNRGAEAAILIRSYPVGARIFFDGVEIGVANRIIYGVTEGEHTLKLTLAGYYDYEGPVIVKFPVIKNRDAIRLKALPQTTGAVSIVSIPTNALVYIDGALSGMTATTVKGLSPGRHSYTLVKDGYRDVSGYFTVYVGKSTYITKNLVQPVIV
ncbi:MAG: PEGA domain-containing protein [Methanomicrobiales archaeon]|nr:PEGA domain-containing protein [Methanomicrobiales archaeon]